MSASAFCKLSVLVSIEFLMVLTFRYVNCAGPAIRQMKVVVETVL